MNLQAVTWELTGWFEILAFKVHDTFEWQLGLPTFFLADLLDLQADALQLKTHWLAWLPHICRPDAETQAQAEISMLRHQLKPRCHYTPYLMRNELRFIWHMTEHAKRYRFCAHMRYFYVAVAAQCLVLDALQLANAELRQQVMHILACAQTRETPEAFLAAFHREPKADAELSTMPDAPQPELHVYLQLVVVQKFALRRDMVRACERIYTAWLKRHRYTVYWPGFIAAWMFDEIDKLEGRDHQPPDKPLMQACSFSTSDFLTLLSIGGAQHVWVGRCVEAQ